MSAGRSGRTSDPQSLRMSAGRNGRIVGMGRRIAVAILGPLAILALVGLTACDTGGGVDRVESYAIAGGGTTGVYFAYGKHLAEALSAELDADFAVEETEGSVDNLLRIGSGEALIGFAQSDAAADAVHDALRDLEQVLLVAEHDAGELELALALDEGLVGAVHHDVRDGRIGKQHFERPEAEQLVDEHLLERDLLAAVERQLQLGEHLADDRPEFLAQLVLGKRRGGFRVDTLQQAWEHLLLDLVDRGLEAFLARGRLIGGAALAGAKALHRVLHAVARHFDGGLGGFLLLGFRQRLNRWGRARSPHGRCVAEAPTRRAQCRSNPSFSAECTHHDPLGRNRRPLRETSAASLANS